MKNGEESLQKAIDYVRTFHREVEQMIIDIGIEIGKNGWECLEGNIVTVDVSQRIGSADRWMPYYLYRNFQNKKVEGECRGIMIFFDHLHIGNFPHSIVCGKIEIGDQGYNGGELLKQLWEDNKDKLSKLKGDSIPLTMEHKGRKISGNLFSIPLSKITNIKDVRERIVEPLLSLK